MKVHVLGNNVKEQTAVIHCIEREVKNLKPVDVSNNEDVEWTLINGRIYVVIVFGIAEGELVIPLNEDEDATLQLSDLSKRFIKETNDVCKDIQRKCKGEVCRLILVPDGRFTPYPLALIIEQWNEQGLSKFIL